MEIQFAGKHWKGDGTISVEPKVLVEQLVKSPMSAEATCSEGLVGP
ncbi:hypothetical protein [Variovorax sp. J22R115]|nr:hypothetical protein [Variovorax sp. J22R115]MDM0053044.1 hypothetical protein [Variovorax sp. J22R115]